MKRSSLARTALKVRIGLQRIGVHRYFEILVLGIVLQLGAGGGIEAAEPRVKVDDNSFKCMLEMTKVRHFYVDNLLGNLEGTVAVAEAGRGEYPEGSVLQLMPNEVMIKQQKGFSPATRDWEFFWIDVSEEGSKIYTRGFAEVNNRFGLNCFACHVKARPEFDFVCEQTNGCDPIAVTREMFGALQRSDPRCKDRPEQSAEDKKALEELAAIVKSITDKQQQETPK